MPSNPKDSREEAPDSSDRGLPEEASDAGGRAAGILSDLLYGASLPERALRGIVGAAGGVLRESARVAVPDSMKGSKLYTLAVEKMLGTLVEDVGGLKAAAGPGGAPGTDRIVSPESPVCAESEPPPPGSGATSSAAPSVPPDESRPLRMAVANVVDLAGMSTLHLSPLWIFAIVSDVALGAKTYLRALVGELKTQGVLDESRAIETVDDLLESIQGASGRLADKLEAPPLTVEELRRSVEEVRSGAKSVDLLKLYPASEIDRVWSEIEAIATKEGCSIFEVASAMGMMALGRVSRVGRGVYGSVKVGFDLLDDNVFEHYARSLARLREKGYYETVAETFEPYLRGLKALFEARGDSYTEELLTGRSFRRLWAALKRWCRCGRTPSERGGSGAENP